MSATTNRFELLTLERLQEIYDLIISAPPGAAAWGTIGPGTGVGSQTDLVTYLNTNYVPVTRTLTINGTTYDLSADRSWTIAAGVSSVTATAPLTSSGGATPNISTSMSTDRLIGRTTAGSGVMEEISVGIGLELGSGVLKSTDFDFTLNFEAADPYTIILPYDFSIDTVDDPGPVTYTITVNASPYTLGTTITALDVVEVTPGAIGWLNLNCTRLS